MLYNILTTHLWIALAILISLSLLGSFIIFKISHKPQKQTPQKASELKALFQKYQGKTLRFSLDYRMLVRTVYSRVPITHEERSDNSLLVGYFVFAKTKFTNPEDQAISSDSYVLLPEKDFNEHYVHVKLGNGVDGYMISKVLLQSKPDGERHDLP